MRSRTAMAGALTLMLAIPALAGTALAQATGGDTALPSLPAPVEVPMHVPKPPQDSSVAQPQAQARPAAPVASARLGDTITPIPPQCRDARYRAVIDGRPELVYAHVCRTADGRWQLTR